MDKSTQHIEQETRAWLQDVVIGLNLCPFARKPERDGLVRYFVSQATDEQTLLDDLQAELVRLESQTCEQLETTLVIVPNSLSDFLQYNQFLDWADELIYRGGWEGVFQVASFHPEYCFADAHSDDPENLTNRSPYPILHLIREQSMADVLDRFGDADKIPERNMATMKALSPAERVRLFPYLFTSKA